MPLLEFDHWLDQTLAVRPDEIGNFVRLGCQEMIELLIKLKQWHLCVIVLPTALTPGCHQLIVIGRTTAQNRQSLIIVHGPRTAGSMTELVILVRPRVWRFGRTHSAFGACRGSAARIRPRPRMAVRPRKWAPHVPWPAGPRGDAVGAKLG